MGSDAGFPDHHPEAAYTGFVRRRSAYSRSAYNGTDSIVSQSGQTCAKTMASPDRDYAIELTTQSSAFVASCLVIDVDFTQDLVERLSDQSHNPKIHTSMKAIAVQI